MKSTLLCVISFLSILIAPVGAENGKIMNAVVKIEKIALFKNGMGFVVGRATLPKGALTVEIGQLPIPSFGTFWVGYPKSLALKSLVTAMEEKQRTIPAHSLGHLLALNPGRKVTVHTRDRALEGTIIAGPAGAAAVEPPSQPDPYHMGPRPSPDRLNRSSADRPGLDLLLLKTAAGTTVVNVSSIERVEFAGETITAAGTVSYTSPGLRLLLEKPAQGETVTVSYLARGVTWAPGYLVDLSDPATARFSAHAVVVNEMADVTAVQLQLVTGFPNVRFGEIMSPVAKAQTLAEFLNALASGGGQGRASGMLTQQVMLNRAPDYGDAEGTLVPGYSTAVDGREAEDLFFYPVAGFSLGKDETAWVPLFTADMPYKHVYTWNVGDALDRQNNYSAGEPAPEEVWHSCRLTNTLAMPLTSAAAEFVTAGEFTGQDICRYTPAKGETTIRINQALNVPAEQAEVETERKRNAATIQGYSYDAVKLRGELRIRNKTGKAITAEISKELSGELLENPQQARDQKTTKGLKQVNPKHLLKWEINLKAGEEKVLTYAYQVYIRN